MQPLGKQLVRADVDLVEKVWRERWGLPLCSVGRTFMPRDVEARALVLGDRMLGLASWVVDGSNAELVTLDSFAEERGAGTQLLTAAEEAMRNAGARRVVAMVSNDNIRTLTFLLHRGYRLEKVHRDLVAELRKIKETIPLIGRAGVPVLDLWELAKPLG